MSLFDRRRRGYGYGSAYGPIDSGPGIVEEVLVTEAIVEDIAEGASPLQMMEDVVEAEVIGSVIDDIF